jgi:cytochrome c1
MRRPYPLVAFGFTIFSGCLNDSGYRPSMAETDAERGRERLRHFECGACHEIPGVPGARGRVGPPLGQYGRRVYVAGKFPNTPAFLVPWIRDAPAMAPQTAMPQVPMSEQDARDMAAYLYDLR